MTEAEKTHSYKKETALTQPRVVIIGGGFGGLCAARGLAGAPVSVTLIDRRNYHLFRPMLYQVATGLLSADQISGPLRSILSRQANVEVLMDEVTGVDTDKRLVRLKQHSISYDYLVLATGIQYNYFGHDEWRRVAPGLESLDDADLIRGKILLAFERAEEMAALDHADADGIRQQLTFVLVGHSMGGMICRLIITDSGHRIWRDFFATPPNKTPLPNDTRKIVEDVFIFHHQPDVQRAIFISTPHRGSDLARSWIRRIGAGFVRTPQRFTSIYNSTKPLLISDPTARPLKRMPNSIDTLEPNDRFVQAVNKLPITPGIPYHSIMGDRGRGDTPNSSDGIVPYWSSHLDGAQSELIVSSDHGAQYNAEAIREVERILKANLAHSND
jgi:pimeloyl-ACP methyl ester carboxylesterase